MELLNRAIVFFTCVIYSDTEAISQTPVTKLASKFQHKYRVFQIKCGLVKTQMFILSSSDSLIQQWVLFTTLAAHAPATHLDVHRTLAVVGGVKHLQPAHVTHVAVEIGAVEAVATLAHGGVRAERLLQLRVGLLLFVLLLD